MTGESDWKMVHAGEAQIKIPAPNPGFQAPAALTRGCSAAEAIRPEANPPPSGQAQLNPNAGGSQ